MATTLQGVQEDASYQVTGTFKDEAGVAVGSAAMSTCKAWLTDHLGAAINSVTGVDILNTGRGVITSAGALTLTLLPGDNPIVGSGKVERHLLIIEWAWATTKKGHAAIYLVVVNDSEIPTA